MDREKLLKKIYLDFKNRNYRENFKDLIKIYKLKKDSDIANKLGTVLANLNKKNFAKYFFEISISLDLNNYKPYYNLANLFKSIDTNYAEEQIDKSLKISKNLESILVKSYLLIQKFDYEKAKNYLKEIDNDEANYLLGVCYLALGNFYLAKTYFEKSLNDNLQINFLNLLTFPRVYKNTREINYFRKKFEKILNKIDKKLGDNKLNMNEAINILNTDSNFYLAYQQKNDLDLNKKYYKLLENIDVRKSNLLDQDFIYKKKIIFISPFFYKHTVLKLFFNFIKEFSDPKKNLEVHILHTSVTKDNWTEKLKKMNLIYNNITNINQIHNFMIKEKFNSAIFLDHSMDHLSQMIINKKYAKNYFMMWGHPITTGSKNVDYFISSKSMDDKNDDQYIEKLILLEGLGTNYKLDEDLINLVKQPLLKNSFFVPQSLFKLLPKYDYLYGKILEENNKASITFIKDKDPCYTDLFKNRLKKNKFIRKNFNRIKFLNRMKQIDFYKELSKYSVILDSIGWSGGNSSLEALYLDKPIVTLKGNTLRGNHTAAILNEINLKELIADNYSEYLKLSKKIMQDYNFFNNIVFKIKKNKMRVLETDISLYNKIKSLI